MFGSIGVPEVLIILAVALLLFGRRIPEAARSLGRGILEFKRGLRDTEEPPADGKPVAKRPE